MIFRLRPVRGLFCLLVENAMFKRVENQLTQSGLALGHSLFLVEDLLRDDLGASQMLSRVKDPRANPVFPKERFAHGALRAQL